jgi:hypothetical protein
MAVLVAACVPIFTGGAFQALKLVFELDDAVAVGEQKLVQTLVFSEGVKVKKNFVQISGRLTAPGGAQLPGRITVRAVQEEVTSGRVIQRITVALSIDENGSFSGKKKIKKNIGADQMMTVTLQPSGSDLPKGTEIALCVDLVKKKKDVNKLPACVEQADDGGGDGNGDGNGGGGQVTTFTSLQNDFFTPTCARAGCHSTGSSQAGLVLAAGQSFGNLVNVASTQVAGLNRVTPNDPENSYLIKKLRGDGDISGSRMPQGGPFLSDEQIGRFVEWIDSGAPDN